MFFASMFCLPGNRRVIASACFVLSVGVAQAQQSGAQTAAPVTVNAQPLQATATAGSIVLQGNVLDPDGAEIPGATVTLTPAAGKAYTGTSGADGTYALRGVPAGTYSLTITMPGFASFVKLGVRVGDGALTVNAKMQVQTQQTVVNVNTNENTVSVDQDNNASATVLKGKDLDALSDDPDELSQELTALAGPAAGPNGGQIYIDGFTGGQLPPKSSIREIRINQNPFSAQYDRPGFGRVEVFTKPGTDKIHGSIQLNGADKSFNTGSVFIAPTTFQPDYHTIFGFGSLTGPINKKASYSLGGSYRDIQDNTVVRPGGVVLDSVTGQICTTPSATCTAAGISNSYNFVQFAPQTRYDFTPRVDLALGEKNTLTVRFQFEHNSQLNQGIGGNDLPSTGANNSSKESTIQISDTQIFSAKVINETRFEYQRPTSTVTPLSTAPTVTVQGGFVAGGDVAQSSNDVQNHIEFQNYTSVALAKHFLRLGGRLRSTSDTNTTTSNANGLFEYNSINDFVSGNTCSVSGSATATPCLAAFQITKIAQPTVSATTVDVGLYAEDDWKVRPNFTFSYGLRYETQNFIHDHKDFAPRVSGAYGLGKKTVIRAGAGFFYDRFTLGNQLSTVRNNGVNQQEFTLTATSAAPIPITCNPGDVAGCAATTSGRLTEQVIAQGGSFNVPNLRAGYQVQENLGVDQQLFKGATMSVNYQHIRGVHQYNSDVPNPNALGTTANPLLYQFQSNGVFNQNQLVTNVNYRGKYGSLGSYYVLNYAKSDTSGAGGFASVPNNLAADYGRASFDVRSRFFMFGSFSLPHLVSVAPFMVAQSGNPYNITSGLDPNNDGIYNSRAMLVSAGTPVSSTGGQVVKTISSCGVFATPGVTGATQLAPVNYCTGPAIFTLNLRVSKTFGFGAQRNAAAAAAAAQGGQQGGPPGGGGRGPGGGGGGGGRGGPGGFGGGGASSGRKYNLTLGAQAANLFNIADRTSPVGVLTSPTFGTSTQLAGNIYTTDSAIRRISLQLSFSF